MSGGTVVIVGGGVAGAATAYWLARAGGRRVVLLEREGDLGSHSTGRNAAILRTAVDAAATRHLALETARFLREPPAGFAPSPLLDPVGLALFESGDGEPPWLADHAAAGEVEELDAAQRARRAPHFEPAGRRGWLFPRQGRIDVAALFEGFVRGAREGGVEVRTRARVERIPVRDGAAAGVELAGGERLDAEWTVLAAGGWARELAPLESTEGLRVTRRHLLVTEPDPRIDPRWPVVWDDAAGLYARPESGGLLISACDVSGVHPDHCRPDPDVKLEVARKVAAHLPAFADAGAAHFWCGLRTLSADDAPWIGPDPELFGLAWVAGLGGHGITTSAACGRLAARLIAGERVDPELRAAVLPRRRAAANGEARALGR